MKSLHSKVSILILATLSKEDQAAVYGLRKPIEELTQNDSPGLPALYKAMSRLYEQGLVEKVGVPVSEGGHPHKQYWRLTEAGIESLPEKISLRLNELRRETALLETLLE